MKLFLVRQEVNNEYDTFDAIVVAAKDDADARTIKELNDSSLGDWVMKVEDLTVTELGTAVRGMKRGIIIQSFNAG